MSYWTRRPLAALVAFVVALVWLPLMASTAHASGPILVPDPTINGCNGVLPTPGSENTHKRLDPSFPSDFNPGGVIGYIVDFPVDASDVGGDFEFTDCVYVDPPGAGNDAPIAKYFVHFVPNAADFHLQFSVPIPADTPIGSQFCNYVKTTASPSASQASNRKAGPACFTVGGALRVEKRSGSTTGPLLPGASFTVVCTPETTSPPTIITGLTNPSVTNGNGTVSASGVAADGTVAINGPSGTPCVVTETAAPAGYQVDATPRNLVIPVGSSQTINVFVNQQLGSLSVSKHAVGGGGTFHFTVSCDDGETYAPFDMTVAAGDTDTHLVSDQITVGTECTVTESANALFTTTSNPANGTVTVDSDGETVAFTNTRKTGSLVVLKAADVDGTFDFDVDCDGTTWDTTLHVTTSGGSGSAHIDNIPTGTSCTVTEQANPLFSSVVTPGNGTVTIAVGDNTVSFTNTRLRGSLVVTKAADLDGTFSFTVDCDGTAYDTTLQITTSGGTGSASVSGIPTGTVCHVAETADPHWTTVIVPANGTVTVGTGDNTVAFTNTRVRGGLDVIKFADLDGTFHFDVDCDGTAYDTTLTVTTSGGSGSAHVDNIPTGTVCAVHEQSDPHWTVVSVPANGSVTIGTGANTVTFTNTRVRGSLQINKTTDEDGTFTFDVDCDGTDYDTTVQISTSNGTGSASVPNIPTDTECTVTEHSDPHFTTVVVPADGTVTIGGESSTVSFTNSRVRGSLVVTKAIVDESGGSGPYSFTFHVSCDEHALPDFTLGTGEGQSLAHQIDGIPTDQVCTVTEDSDPTWSTVVTPSNGQATIAVSEVPPTVAFANTKLYTKPSLAKSSDPVSGTAVTDGDTITYTLSFANAGNIAANVSITDAIPAGTTYVAGSAGDGTLSGGTLTWNRSIAAAGSATVSFAVTVNAGLTDPFTIDNVAVLHEGETDTPSNETHHPVAHVKITKAVDQAVADYGDSLTYTLHVSNPSAATLTFVSVTDPLPEGTTFVSATDGGTCAAPCTTISWPLFTLAPGESVDRMFVVTIDTPAAAADGAIPQTTILNSAAVGSAETPTSPSNQVKTVVNAVLGIKIVKPPELPKTGTTFPIPQSVAMALALLLAGAGLTYGGRRRRTVTVEVGEQ
jgi:uncharacterized repeat protein (TIGR01451 family)/LPXTG-motif cell wall-anchored protein